MKVLDVVYNRSSAKYTALLVDEDGVPVPVANISTATLTLKEQSTDGVINNRNAQNVKNANGVTIDSNGNLQWDMDAADLTPVTTRPTEVHVATFIFNYSNGKKLTYPVAFRIKEAT